MMKDGDKDEYVDCGILVKLISDQIQNQSNKLLHRKNLTASQFRYLEYLDRNSGTASFKEVERHFQTSQPTVSGIMRRLAGKDLIVIESAGGRHAKNACLTGKGRKLIEDGGTRRGLEEKMLLSALDDDERVVFHDMLERINEKLSE